MITEKLCKTCGAVKPVEDMVKDNSTKDGYQGICKTCKKKRLVLQGSDPFKVTERLLIGFKLCKTCGDMKPLESMMKDKVSKDGYRNICKSCVGSQQKLRASNPIKVEERLSIGTKICNQCKIEKSLEKMVKSTNSSDGYRCLCLVCMRKKQGVQGSTPEKVSNRLDKGFKICIHCDTKKPLEEMTRRRTNSDGFGSTCKECDKNHHKLRNPNKEAIAAILAIGSKLCTRCHIEKPLEEMCKDKSFSDSFATCCKKCKAEKARDRNSTLSGRVKQRNYRRKRRSTTKGKMEEFIRRSLYRSLSGAKANKPGKTFDFVGYTPQEAIDHFNKGRYTWADYMLGGFDIDHIVPVSYFVKRMLSEVDSDNNLTEEGLRLLKLCNSLENLRVWESGANATKSDMLDIDLVEEYSLYHLLE